MLRWLSQGLSLRPLCWTHCGHVQGADPVYGFSLGWKGALVVLFVMVALTILTIIWVLQKSSPVSDLWQANYKMGLVEVGVSRVFRLTDPKG